MKEDPAPARNVLGREFVLVHMPTECGQLCVKNRFFLSISNIEEYIVELGEDCVTGERVVKVFKLKDVFNDPILYVEDRIERRKPLQASFKNEIVSVKKHAIDPPVPKELICSFTNERALMVEVELLKEKLDRLEREKRGDVKCDANKAQTEWKP